MLCKADHLLQNCPGIPKVLDVWSIGSHQPLSSTSRVHVGEKPSTSNNKVHGKKGKVKFQCKLCEGDRPIHLCPLLDETSKELENFTASEPHLLAGYQNISHDPSLVDLVIDQKSSLVNPTLSKSESREFVLDHPLVEKTVAFTVPSVNHASPVESEPCNA